MKLLRKLRALFRRKKLETDMAEEMQAHLELRTKANITAGMSPEEARYAARRRFGGVEQIKEACRDQRGFIWLERCAMELRQTTKRLCREKGFTTTVLTTFMLCLGANVVIFSIVNAVLINPLPFPDADRIVTMINRYPKIGIARGASSVVQYFQRRAGIPAFSAVAALRPGSGVVGDTGSPQRIVTMEVTPSFFAVLGVQPQFGRVFLEEEGALGANAVALLTDSYWRRHYNADSAVTGQTIILDGIPRTIVGVLPPNFRYLSTEAVVLTPLAFSPGERQPWMGHAMTLTLIARLKSSVSMQEAEEQVNALYAHLAKDDPLKEWAKDSGFYTFVAGLRADHVARVRSSLVLIQLGTLLLLLIGGVNILNLLSVRATGRSKEFAVRQVLGASRRSLAMQLVCETSLLAVMGGVLGLGLGAASLKLLPQFEVRQLPLAADISLSPVVAASALALSVVIGLLLSVPLIGFSLRQSLTGGLTTESRSGTVTRSTQRLRHTLISVQIALAFVFLTSASFLGLSVRKVLAVNPGFVAENVLTAWVNLPAKTYKSGKEQLDFLQRWLRALSTLPGVDAVGLGTSLPVVGDIGRLTMVAEGHSPGSGVAAWGHHYCVTSGDYFAALGVPLREGRFFKAEDSESKQRVCVIDDEFARQYWPEGGSLGHRIWIGSKVGTNDQAWTIVGIVGSVKQLGLTDREALGMMYYPFRSETPSFRPETAPLRMAAIVRTSLKSEGLVPSMRNALLTIDSSVALDDVKTMNTRVDDTTMLPRLILLLACLFAGIGLLLSAIGVYGVLAYAVAQRQREIGIRLALGAVAARIVKQFLRLGARLWLFGMLFGAVGAWFAAQAMSSFLFEISTKNLFVYAAAAVLLSAVVLVASLLPSLSAAAVSITEALRGE